MSLLFPDVCQIKATDSDENSDLLYRITSCNCYDENESIVVEDVCNNWFDIQTKTEVDYTKKLY